MKNDDLASSDVLAKISGTMPDLAGQISRHFDLPHIPLHIQIPDVAPQIQSSFARWRLPMIDPPTLDLSSMLRPVIEQHNQAMKGVMTQIRESTAQIVAMSQTAIVE